MYDREAYVFPITSASCVESPFPRKESGETMSVGEGRGKENHNNEIFIPF